ELLEEHFGGGDGAEEVHLDHGSVVLALLRGEGAQQHDARVVDEDVGAAEFVLHARGGGQEGVAVGDVGADGDCAAADVVRDRGDAVDAAGEQSDGVAGSGELSGGGFADAGGR